MEVKLLINNKSFSIFTIFLLTSSLLVLTQFSVNVMAEEGEEDPLAEAGLSLIALRNDTLDTNQDGDNDAIRVVVVFNTEQANTNLVNGLPSFALYNEGMDWAGYNWGYGGFWYWGWGEQYGMSPQYAQYNGWFNMNPREGKISFSSNLVGAQIVLEYISDGLAYDLDSRIPKMAEDALYSYISHAILSTSCLLYTSPSPRD